MIKIAKKYFGILFACLISGTALAADSDITDFASYWKAKAIQRVNTDFYVVITVCTIDPYTMMIAGPSDERLEFDYDSMCSRKIAVKMKEFADMENMFTETAKKKEEVAKSYTLQQRWLIKIAYNDIFSSKVKEPVIVFTSDQDFEKFVVKDGKIEKIYDAPPRMKEWLTESFGVALYLKTKKDE